tara:strand:- start:1126 stop:1344 length:219 start_codon:yes stop_codon:yes gene_type:complete
MTREDKVDILVASEIERIAQLFKTTSDTLTGAEYDSLDRMFRFNGITPFDKKSNAMIDLEYNETINKEYEDA